MSVAHICHGQDRVGSGVRGAAAFWAWNQVQVSHCQTASSMALFMPSQKTHPHANNWDLVVPWWNLWSCCSILYLSDGGTMRTSPCRTWPSTMVRVSQCCQFGHNRQGTTPWCCWANQWWSCQQECASQSHSQRLAEMLPSSLGTSEQGG